MDIQRGDKILDLGCGAGRNACIMATYLRDDGKICGMDVASVAFACPIKEIILIFPPYEGQPL